MRVIVYVEGPSDKLAMEALLLHLIENKRQTGVEISFFEAPSGDKKKSVVQKVPERAVNILRNDPDSIVVAMPDLHPKNKGCEHETSEQLIAGIKANFSNALAKKKLRDDRILDRFHAFCFKHDFEALLLACEDVLKTRLNTDVFRVEWHKPVEDQNHDHCPKRIVEELFQAHDQFYRETVDAPAILGVANLPTVTDACPQCFKPFIDFLNSL